MKPGTNSSVSLRASKYLNSHRFAFRRMTGVGRDGCSSGRRPRITSSLAKRADLAVRVTRRNRQGIRKRLNRNKVLEFFAQLEPCLVGMEACAGAHYWGREVMAHGHTVKLMAPQFVKPYVKANKTDAADAEAICEAVARPNMRFVPIKSAGNALGWLSGNVALPHMRRTRTR